MIDRMISLRQRPNVLSTSNGQVFQKVFHRGEILSNFNVMTGYHSIK